MIKENKPKKSLGQNFLIDPDISNKILDAVKPSIEDNFLEIGAGKGALTKLFLNKVKIINATEIDNDLIKNLKELEISNSNLSLIEENILNIELKEIVKNGTKCRVIGNLPYYLSSEIMLWSFKNAEFIKDMHYMFQREFGERLISRPGKKSYGRLSVLSQYMFKGYSLFKISSESFKPKPSVESIFIKFVPIENKDINSTEAKSLQEITRLLFSKRRKKISTTLKGILSKKELTDLKINPDNRPESLNINDFLKLTSSF